MSVNFRSFRIVSLAAALAITVGIGSLASAQDLPARQALQDTPAPTEVDIDTALPLTIGTAVTTPLDKDIYFHRNFTFNGKANDLMIVTATHLTGNYGFDLTVTSQNDVTLASATGGFMVIGTLTVKLPQDGNYKIRVDIIDPGAGDFRRWNAIGGGEPLESASRCDCCRQVDFGIS